MPLFKSIPGARPGRSVFNLTNERKTTCDMGQLIPIMCDEVIPSDHFRIGVNLVIRMQPLVAPVLHRITAHVHYFFVPYRILEDDFEEFITGGVDGATAVTLNRWAPTDVAEGSLWDYLDFPTTVTPDADNRPLAMPREAYNKIYNDYYRDENLTSEVALTSEDILLRSWEKDYFTSAFITQQRGTAPSLPISGSTSAVWPAVSAANLGNMQQNNSTNVPYDANTKATLENNTIDLSPATSVDISDLRASVQVQRFMERNMRAGVRMPEFLEAHFGVKSSDARLQRPEFLGGSRTPVIISEVLQTSETGGTPQGNLAGHGITVDQQFICNYRVPEFGLIMGILSIMPKPLYQQGIDRQWLRETRYDFPFPLFANLSEQEVLQREIFLSGVKAENETVFGYQGRYDELRYKPSKVTGEMRSTYDYWHLSRQFSVAPTLTTSFVECDPRKDIFAAPSEPGFIVSVGNLIRAVRPIPVMSDPGRLDH